MPRQSKPQFRLGFVEPSLPTLSKVVPSGPEWVHELKHDGYRLLARKSGDRVMLFTRGGHDWSDRYPLIAQSVAEIPAKSVLIDGEAVICGEDGVSDFDALHSRTLDKEATLFAFDLMEVDGEDWCGKPLTDRKAWLRKLVRRSGAITFNPHFEGDGAVIFQHVCKLGLEGIVSKRRDMPYRPGRTKSWVKIKNPTSPAMTRVKDGTF